MTVKVKGTGRYRQARLVAVAVVAMLATVVLAFVVGAVAPFVSTPSAGRAGSAVLPTEAAPPVAAPLAPPGPMLGCGSGR